MEFTAREFWWLQKTDFCFIVKVFVKLISLINFLIASSIPQEVLPVDQGVHVAGQ